MIEGYEHQQVRLRAQITSLKRGKLMKTLGTNTAAAIRRTERQITDLERGNRKMPREGSAPNLS
jgi:hypothetical protein